MVANVCDQVLREVCRNEHFSSAHVTMSPQAKSLPHHHKLMSEIYVFTRGFGTMRSGGLHFPVQPGYVRLVRPHMTHHVVNEGMTNLEHLVLAFPPFDPGDVIVGEKDQSAEAAPLLPELRKCFDGAMIMSNSFHRLNTSVAFGWTAASNPDKRAHYHNKTTEFIYVVEGQGIVQLDGFPSVITAGDWICIRPGVSHALIPTTPQHLVVTCICTPRFDRRDVHYKK
jgi:mannose-6-phosphate isomerase-like protein (cupin superfamily)